MTKKEFARNCTECGAGMNEGYCFDGGRAYYCSDACLHKHFTHDEWEKLYFDGGRAYSCWTTWDEDPDEYMVDEDDMSDSEKLTRIATAVRKAYELVEEGSEAQGYLAEALAYADGDLSSFDEEV